MSYTLNYGDVGTLIVSQDVEEPYSATEAVLTAVSLVHTIPDDQVLDDVVDTDALDRIFAKDREGGTLLLDLWGMNVVVTPDEVRVYSPE